MCGCCRNQAVEGGKFTNNLKELHSVFPVIRTIFIKFKKWFQAGTRVKGLILWQRGYKLVCMGDGNTKQESPGFVSSGHMSQVSVIESPDFVHRLQG